jgi:hypothetical protein
MMRVGGGGNDPEFLKWLLFWIILAGLWGMVTYWPRRLSALVRLKRRKRQ